MSQLPRVLVVGTVPDRSEAAVIQALRRRNLPMAVVVRHDATRLDADADAGLRLTKVGLRWTTQRSDVEKLRHVAHEFRPDVVHILRSPCLALWRHAMRGRTSPPILFYRGTTEVPRWWNPSHRRKYLGSTVACFHAVSNAVRDALVAGGVAPDRIVVVRKGHDPAWYRAAAIDLRAELGLGQDSFLAGIVANIRHEKGVEYAVAASDLLAQRGIDVPFVLVGDDERPVWQRRRTKLARDGRIFLLGRRSDVPALLPNFDVFVMPSLREGSPRAVVEAMLCHVPVIASAVGGVPELIADGATGLLVPPAHAAALADAVARLKESASLRRELAHAAATWVHQHLSVEAAADALLEVYRRLTPSMPAESVDAPAPSE